MPIGNPPIWVVSFAFLSIHVEKAILKKLAPMYSLVGFRRELGQSCLLSDGYSLFPYVVIPWTLGGNGFGKARRKEAFGAVCLQYVPRPSNDA